MYFSFLSRIFIERFMLITMANEDSKITEEMLKDCDANFLEGSLDGVENTPPVEAINDSMTDDYFQMLDEIKFLKTKLSEKDREINFLKQDLDRTLDVS